MKTEIKKWSINEAGIIKSLEAVMKSGDIEKLTKDAYNFTMNISGFIAHYNQGGFMSNYRNVADLINDLENSSDISRPEYYTNDRYFSEGDQREYYASKSRILLAIGEMVKKYKGKNADAEEEMITEKWNQLKNITARNFSTDEKKILLTKFNLI